MKFPLSIATPLATLLFAAWAHRAGKPNVVFIVVDNLNDHIKFRVAPGTWTVSAKPE
jgi:hypothetical protein